MIAETPPSRTPQGAFALWPPGGDLAVKVLAVLLALGLAGCRRCRDPELVPYETPAEAVYRVAAELGARGELEARRMALEHIVARYPSSRFAVMAREDLEDLRERPGRGDAAR